MNSVDLIKLNKKFNGYYKNGKQKWKTITVDGEPKYRKRKISR